MYRLLFLIPDLLASLPGLLPVLLILHFLRVRSWARSGLYLLFSLYLAGVWLLTGLPDVTYIRFYPEIQFIPFAGLAGDIENALLNVALFVPLGALLPLLFPGFQKFDRVLLFGLCASLTVELLQIFALRTTDVNDLLTNTAGAALGYALWRAASSILPNLRPGRPWDLWLLCGTVGGVMFFVQPLIGLLF